MIDDLRVELACPAKVNLALSFGGPNGEGMHPIASWMVAVDFSDQLTVDRLDGGESRFDLAFAHDAPAPPRGGVDWPLEKDLAYRAHGLMQSHTRGQLPIAVTLRKRIPTGAGLGGGSSDAAGVMVATNKLFDLGLDTATLVRIGRTLGSDVSFAVAALMGKPSAIVTGTGEVLEPCANTADVHLVLIFPGPDAACPTRAVFQTFDRITPDIANKTADETGVRTLAQHPPLPPEGPFNDLTDAACTVQPVLREIKIKIENALHQPVHITGSGSTLYTVAHDDNHAKDLADHVRRQTGLHAVQTRTLPVSS
ncbi:MAG: 4-(cytidine 5'-diphospho)-2-C-methyl-D-erythritol kinase [Phycisphaera sp.]|nr:4-(cytidine 5'-diphospho)-2-C-methyl-D-erythritol kinase [Phycisphaera sp.]